MGHDINKRSFFNLFKKNRIIKRLSTIVAAKKNCKQRLIHSPSQQVPYKHHQNFSLT